MAAKRAAKKPAPKKPRAKSSKPDIDPSSSLPVPAAMEPTPKRGRATVYSDALRETICEQLAEGRTLNAIVKSDETLPAARTIRRWAADPDHPFSPHYARAREVGYHSMSDETVDIGDIVSADPGEVAKARLRVDTRKWLLSKALPKIYGDKVALTDGEGGPLSVQIVRFSDTGGK